MRMTNRFEAEVMQKRTAVIAVALASILAGVAAFVIGLRQPIASTHVGVASYSQAAP
jgi:hypothetical protein